MLTPIKAANLIYQTTSILFADYWRPSARTYSIEAWMALRAAYSYGHSRIPTVNIQQFCQKITLHPPYLIQYPAFDTMGIGNSDYFECLGMICATRSPRIVVEWGTYLGASTMTFAANTCADARIITIDLPDHAKGAEKLNRTDRNLVEASRGRIGVLYKDTPYATKIQEVRADSTKLRMTDITSSCDLAFVDGGHDWRCISTDTENARAIMADGGIIIWDDYWWQCPDVVRFLNGLSKELELVRIRGTNLVATIIRCSPDFCKGGGCA
jgi:predicted O-methyltransferase YrrM